LGETVEVALARETCQGGMHPQERALLARTSCKRSGG